MKTMEHTPHDFSYPISAALSLLSVVIAWISLRDAQIVIAIIASVVAIVSGLFAVRYYYYATKEKKKNLTNDKD
jgi:hypothetical protein